MIDEQEVKMQAEIDRQAEEPTGTGTLLTEEDLDEMLKDGEIIF